MSIIVESLLILGLLLGPGILGATALWFLAGHWEKQHEKRAKEKDKRTS